AGAATADLASVGRSAGRTAGLDGVGRIRSTKRIGVGRRVRRRRRGGLESRRPDTGRPDRRPELPANTTAVNRSPVAALGAGTVAVAGDQRRTSGDRAGRRPGRPDREAVPTDYPAEPLHRRVAVDWVDSDYRRSVRKSSTTVE